MEQEIVNINKTLDNVLLSIKKVIEWHFKNSDLMLSILYKRQSELEKKRLRIIKLIKRELKI